MHRNFSEWATEQGLSLETINGVYLDEKTEFAFKGWKARVYCEDAVLEKYGICKNCLTHYKPNKDLKSMECDCTIRQLDSSFIVNLLKDK